MRKVLTVPSQEVADLIAELRAEGVEVKVDKTPFRRPTSLDEQPLSRNERRVALKRTKKAMKNAAKQARKDKEYGN